jgi:hypothetical protein
MGIIKFCECRPIYHILLPYSTFILGKISVVDLKKYEQAFGGFHTLTSATVLFTFDSFSKLYLAINNHPSERCLPVIR